MTHFRGGSGSLLSIIEVLSLSAHNLVVLMTLPSNQYQIRFIGQCNGLTYGSPSVRFDKIP